MTDRFLWTTAVERLCVRCHAPVLMAHSEGVRTFVDAEVIGTIGGAGISQPAEALASRTRQTRELEALMRGDVTYVRTRGGELVERTAERIRGATIGGTIHVEHRCPDARSMLRRSA